MVNPPKGVVVKAYWPKVNDTHWFLAKWTGRRWLRFNELFGGYDPVESPESWKKEE